MKSSGNLLFTQMGISLSLTLNSDISRYNDIYYIWSSRTSTSSNTNDNGNANALHLQHAA